MATDRSNDLIRLKFLSLAGEQDDIVSNDNTRAEAVTYVGNYLTAGGGNIQANVGAYPGGAPGRVGGHAAGAAAAAAGAAAVAAARADLEKVHRQDTLFGAAGAIKFCGVNVAGTVVRQIMHAALAAAGQSVDRLNGLGAVAVAAGGAGPGVNANALANHVEAVTAMAECYDNADAAVDAHLQAGPPPPAVPPNAAANNYVCDEYLRAWGRLSPEAKHYILARMAGFARDPMFQVIGGDNVETGDYKEVTVRCKVDASNQDHLRSRAGVAFQLKNEDPADNVYNFPGGKPAIVYMYEKAIESPAL